MVQSSSWDVPIVRMRGPAPGRADTEMHPFVRDLYKRVLHVGRDYPTGLPHVRDVWKRALRNPANCPACYAAPDSPECQEQLLRAVHRGRVMVKEMVGVVQLKKYRAMRERYDGPAPSLEEALRHVEGLGRRHL